MRVGLDGATISVLEVCVGRVVCILCIGSECCCTPTRTLLRVQAQQVERHLMYHDHDHDSLASAEGSALIEVLSSCTPVTLALRPTGPVFQVYVVKEEATDAMHDALESPLAGEAMV